MNYVSAVYGVLVFIITTDWFVRARKSFRGQKLRHSELEDHVHSTATSMEKGGVADFSEAMTSEA